MIKLYSKIFLALITLLSLACNLLSIPQEAETVNIDPVKNKQTPNIL